MANTFNLPTFSKFDDLLMSTYKNLLNYGTSISGKRGEITELSNYAAVLSNPRSRVSSSLDRRFVRSKFAEFAWYLSKDSSKEYISPYISAYNDEESLDKKILGAYGPRIFGSDGNSKSQYQTICEQINKRVLTKQAYLVISYVEDYKLRTDKFKSPPCTIGLHFLVRNEKLNLTVYMRSNDAYYGLPHDLFCFTMLQEMISLETGIPMGSYIHICTSMHVYSNQLSGVSEYIKEGYHEDFSMPVMTPFDDEIIKIMIDSYNDKIDILDEISLPDYWNDFCLFSNRYKKESSNTKWVERFKIEEMRKIAKSSVST